MVRPMLKRIYSPFTAYEGVLRLGFQSPLFEIEDPDGTVFQLLHLLDGTHDIDDLSAILEVPSSEVEEAVAALDQARLLEDADAGKGCITPQDAERYRANLNYFSNFADLQTSKFLYQTRLAQSSVAVLGLGGASLVANCLAGLGIGRIIGVDYDKVEVSNLNRQFLYAEADIGKLKSEATADRLRKINGSICIDVHNRRINGAGSLRDILSSVDLVINGIDQPAIMSTRWVNAACVGLKLPFLQGGISNTKITWQRIVPGESGCFDCFLIDALRHDPDFEMELRTAHGSSFDKRNAATAPHAALLSGYLSAEAAKCLAGYAEPIPAGVTVELDTLTMNIVTKPAWKRQPDCPTCETSLQGIKEPVDLDHLITIAKAEARTT